MIDAKKELQYRLAIRMLEHLSEKGLLSAKELAYGKRDCATRTPTGTPACRRLLPCQLRL